MAPDDENDCKLCGILTRYRFRIIFLSLVCIIFSIISTNIFNKPWVSLVFPSIIVLLFFILAIIGDHLFRTNNCRKINGDKTKDNNENDCLEKVKRYYGPLYKWLNDNNLILLFILISFIISVKSRYSLLSSILLIALTIIIANVLNKILRDNIKEQKKGYFCFIILFWLTLIIIPWPGLFTNNNSNTPALFSLDQIGTKKVLQICNVTLLSWQNNFSDTKETSTIPQSDTAKAENDNSIDKQNYLFDQYSWYISLIITVLGTVVGFFMYYNWRSAQKIKEEWEELRGKTLKKETEINKAFQAIRDEVLNDPRLGNGKDEDKLQNFAKAFREGQIDLALKYAFVAREIQPRLKPEGKYTKQEIDAWEAALQYWILAAYFLSDKDAYEKEHKGFIYDGLGNAYRQLANYGVKKIVDYKPDTGQNLNTISIWAMVKNILLNYGKALSAYEIVLASEPDHSLVINNKANLFLEVYRFRKQLLDLLGDNTKNREDYDSYWQESIASLTNNWESFSITGGAYCSTDQLLDVSCNLLGDLIVKKGLSKFDYILHQDVWYYRNYAITSYLLVKEKNANYMDTEGYDKFIKYLEKSIVYHKDGKEKALLELMEDEDLQTNKVFEEEKVLDMLKRLDLKVG